MWSHRLAVRTPASHAGNRGSIPRGITIKYIKDLGSTAKSFLFWLKINTQHYTQLVAPKSLKINKFSE